MPFFATLRKDFAMNDKRFTLGSFAFHLLWHSRYNALILIRAFLWLQDRHLPTFLPDFFLRTRYQIEILKPVTIGPELYLPHPFGIVITMGTHIGARCNLYALVRMLTTPSGSPVVEDDVFLSDGVRLVGGVRIGAGSLIGAGAVVTKDIPPGVVAVGIPAKVIKAAGWRK
ncbi:MAG: serine acetyltransferase [Verrucomicrobiales bacterium]|nr:serine acetyltransferase [Verrucomicrobiales bacterium]